ncbi:MAG: hypothetical protein DRN96_05920, partial [Thermoproteota archaeon]
ILHSPLSSAPIYSDIVSMYRYRPPLQHAEVPYRDYMLEYPPAVGALIYLASLSRSLLLYCLVHFLAMAPFAYLLGLMLERLKPDVSPGYLLAGGCLLVYGYYNWDVPAVALLLAYMHYRGGSWWKSGLTLGAASLFKLYPIYAVAAELRERRLKSAALAIALAALTLPLWHMCKADEYHWRWWIEDSWMLWVLPNTPSGIRTANYLSLAGSALAFTLALLGKVNELQLFTLLFLTQKVHTPQFNIATAALAAVYSANIQLLVAEDLCNTMIILTWHAVEDPLAPLSLPQLFSLARQALLALLAAGLRPTGMWKLAPLAMSAATLATLPYPNAPVFDELYYTQAAASILKSWRDPNVEHPPLAKLMIAAGALIAQETWALRLIPALVSMAAGALGLHLLSRRYKADFTAAYLIAYGDLLYWTFTRSAMLDAPAASLMLLSLGLLEAGSLLWPAALAASLCCKLSTAVPAAAYLAARRRKPSLGEATVAAASLAAAALLSSLLHCKPPHKDIADMLAAHACTSFSRWELKLMGCKPPLDWLLTPPWAAESYLKLRAHGRLLYDFREAISPLTSLLIAYSIAALKLDHSIAPLSAASAATLAAYTLAALAMRPTYTHYVLPLVPLAAIPAARSRRARELAYIQLLLLTAAFPIKHVH